jgi:hypothetical protein
MIFKKVIKKNRNGFRERPTNKIRIRISRAVKKRKVKENREVKQRVSITIRGVNRT